MPLSTFSKKSLNKSASNHAQKWVVKCMHGIELGRGGVDKGGGEGWSYEIANNNTRDAKNVSFTLDCRIIIIIQQKQVLRGAIGRLIK